MKLLEWRQVAELIGISAIVASLIFVGIQVQQEQGIGIAGTYGTFSESTINLADLVDRNADIWKKGLDGDELSDIEMIKFSAMVGAVQTHFSNMHIRWSWIGPVSPEVAARKYAYAVHMFPGLRRARARQLDTLELGSIPRAGTLTSSAFEGDVDRILKEYEAESTAVPAEKEYVFW